MNAFDPLLKQTESSFGFLVQQGFTLVSREFLASDSFKGGFLAKYSNGKSTIEIEYLEQQFEVRCDSKEVFGPSLHPGFGGNMFSSQRIVEYLPSIAQIVRQFLLSLPSA